MAKHKKSSLYEIKGNIIHEELIFKMVFKLKRGGGSQYKHFIMEVSPFYQLYQLPLFLENFPQVLVIFCENFCPGLFCLLDHSHVGTEGHSA